MTDKKATSHVPSGYEIGTDEQGLTARERAVRDLIAKGHTRSYIGAELGVSRVRVGQLVKSLTDKGVVAKEGGLLVVKVEPKK